VYIFQQQQVDAALVGVTFESYFGYFDANNSASLMCAPAMPFFDCFADNGYIKWGFLGITSG
jgi:hypothetical protein